MPQRVPRYRKAENFRQITIASANQAILEAIAKFHYLSEPQITRLLYSKGTRKTVMEHLSELYHADYLERVYLYPFRGQRGAPLAFYTLDKKGYTWARTNGILAPDERFHKRQLEVEQLFLRHTRSENDLLILCKLLAKQDPRVTIPRMLTENELKRRPIYVQIGKERVGVVPDGWVQFHSKAWEICVAFELDRGTVAKRDWQRKILAYLADEHPYKEEFGTSALTVAVLTTEGQSRMRELLIWTEQALEQARSERKADLFHFAAFDPAKADPEEAFYLPRFFIPFDPAPTALLAGLFAE